MAKTVTVKEYLAELVKRAHGTPHLKKGDEGYKPRIPQLANFLEEHDFVGTLRGSPVWRRNEKFYRRNARG